MNRYATVLELLRDARDYADPLGEWDLQQYRDEMKRIYNTVNEAIGRLGGEMKPRKPYISEPAEDIPASASSSASHP